MFASSATASSVRPVAPAPSPWKKRSYGNSSKLSPRRVWRSPTAQEQEQERRGARRLELSQPHKSERQPRRAAFCFDESRLAIGRPVCDGLAPFWGYLGLPLPSAVAPFP